MREWALLQHVFGHNAELPDAVTIPPGDDMGGLRIGDRELLVTVDQVADGVHVNTSTTSLELIARKLIVRNLSDVAAMAGEPIGAVATACLPRDFGQSRAEELFDHLRRIAANYHCPLIGGDVSMWDQPLLLTMTIFAAPVPDSAAPVLRSGAKVGDGIYVTGRLGGAWDEQGGGPHLTAEPRLAVARRLAADAAVQLHAMIDLSDGLAGDLRHICEQSHAGAEIDAAAVPCRDGAMLQNALGDGEDYELCFTTSGKAPAEIDGVAITRIGRVVEAGDPASRITLVHAGGRREPLAITGWEHKDRPS
mgnify:CR=1 FL=1